MSCLHVEKDKQQMAISNHIIDTQSHAPVYCHKTLKKILCVIKLFETHPYTVMHKLNGADYSYYPINQFNLDSLNILSQLVKCQIIAEKLFDIAFDSEIDEDFLRDTCIEITHDLKGFVGMLKTLHIEHTKSISEIECQTLIKIYSIKFKNNKKTYCLFIIYLLMLIFNVPSFADIILDDEIVWSSDGISKTMRSTICEYQLPRHMLLNEHKDQWFRLLTLNCLVEKWNLTKDNANEIMLFLIEFRMLEQSCVYCS